MIDIVEATEGVLALGFAAVTLMALRAGARRGLHVLSWLAAAFATLALGATLGRQLVAPTEAGPLIEAALRLGRALAFFPGYFLVRFLHEIEPAPVWLRRVVLAGAVVPAAAVLSGVVSPSPSAGITGAALVLAGLFAATYVGAHAWVAWRFLGASRRVESSVLRGRLLTMAGASVLTGSLVVLAFGASSLAALLSRVAAFTAVALLWFAIQPPAVLRLLARQRDAERIRSLRRSLLTATDPVDLAEHLVAALATLTGAEAAWLHHGGRVLAHHRLDAATAASHDAVIQAGAGPTFPARVMLRVPGERAWIAAAPIDGGWLAVQTTPYTPIFGTDELTRLDAVAEDLDLALERTRVQRREREALHRLEQAAELRNDFLSTMSHELRTPLTSIRGFAELLLTSGDQIKPAMRTDLLARVVRNAGDLERVLTGLLQLTSLQEGSYPSRVEVHELPCVVDDAVRRTASACERHELDLDVQSVTLSVDGEALSDALEQLLRNAASFSPPGSPIHVRGWCEGDRFVLEVEDHGIGLPAAERERLFEPFSRAGDVLTRDTRGTGIGLAIVAKLVELLGGDLEVESETNEGSTFRLSFPAIAPRQDVAPDGVVVEHTHGVPIGS